MRERGGRVFPGSFKAALGAARLSETRPVGRASAAQVNIALAMLPWRVVRSVVATTGSEASSLSELQRVPGRATQTDTSELRLAIEGCLREAGVEQAGGIFSPFTPYQE